MRSLFPGEQDRPQDDQAGPQPFPSIDSLAKKQDGKTHCYDHAKLVDRCDLRDFANLERPKITKP